MLSQPPLPLPQAGMSRSRLGGRRSPQSVHPQKCPSDGRHLFCPQREGLGQGPATIPKEGGNFQPLLGNRCLLSTNVESVILYSVFWGAS